MLFVYFQTFLSYFLCIFLIFLFFLNLPVLAAAPDIVTSTACLLSSILPYILLHLFILCFLMPLFNVVSIITL